MPPTRVDHQTGDSASGGGSDGDICVGDFISSESDGDDLDGSTCEFTVDIATP